MYKTSVKKKDYEIQYQIEQTTHSLTCVRDNSNETITCQANFTTPIYNLPLIGQCYGCAVSSTGFFCRGCAKIYPAINKFRKQSVSYFCIGYSSISGDPEIKQQKKDNMIEKYGVDNPSKILHVREKLSKIATDNASSRLEKAKLTNQKRYGVDHYSQTDAYKEQYKKTSQQRYGVDHPLSANSVRDKYAATMQARYGVDNPSQDADTVQRRALTNLERYGNICSAQNADIQNKITQHTIETYGVAHHFQRDDVISKSKETRQILKYGKLLLEFRDVWREEYFASGLASALIKFPKIKVKTAVDTFLTSDERISNQGRSHSERLVREFFQQYLSLDFQHSKRSIVPGNNRLEIDMLNQDHKLSIEFNGYYWHQIVVDKISADKHKAQSMRDVGWHHLALDETDLQKLPMLGALLSHDKRPMGARRCTIVKVNSQRERAFLNENHLDGYVASQYCYGLEFMGELVQLMSFTHDRFGKKQHHGELLRLATLQGISIIGGSKRLFCAAMKEIQYHTIISYSNIKYFDGAVYPTLGFSYVKDTVPGYVWVKGSGSNILRRYSTMKHKLPALLGEKFDSSMTEDENMTACGWTKVKDLGHKKWVYSR